MSTDGHPINHCELTREAAGQMSKEAFAEAVMQRSGEIVRGIVTGQPVGQAQIGAVEVCAFAIAQAVLIEGANQIASDMNVDLQRLTRLALSQHISSC